MSLDIYLTLKGETSDDLGSGIFIRENGQTKEISRLEWNEKFPDREPVIANQKYEDEVYQCNITHNLNTMAKEAGIYKHLWRPDEIGIIKASDLIEPLRKALTLLESDPERFKAFNPSNNWGNYDGFVNFVKEYQAACVRWPAAEISISR